MTKTKVLLVGELGDSATHYKGFDQSAALPFIWGQRLSMP